MRQWSNSATSFKSRHGGHSSRVCNMPCTQEAPPPSIMPGSLQCRPPCVSDTPRLDSFRLSQQMPFLTLPCLESRAAVAGLRNWVLGPSNESSCPKKNSRGAWPRPATPGERIQRRRRRLWQPSLYQDLQRRGGVRTMGKAGSPSRLQTFQDLACRQILWNAGSKITGGAMDKHPRVSTAFRKRQLNPNSNFHLSFNIGYPNAC